jgi:hypothetical protein
VRRFYLQHNSISLTLKLFYHEKTIHSFGCCAYWICWKGTDCEYS